MFNRNLMIHPRISPYHFKFSISNKIIRSTYLRSQPRHENKFALQFPPIYLHSKVICQCCSVQIKCETHYLSINIVMAALETQTTFIYFLINCSRISCCGRVSILFWNFKNFLGKFQHAKKEEEERRGNNKLKLTSVLTCRVSCARREYSLTQRQMCIIMNKWENDHRIEHIL